MTKLPFIIILSISLLSPLLQAAEKKQAPKTKSLIIVIGDGMGYPQINLLNQFLKFSKQNQKSKIPFAFDRLAKVGSTGISTNHSKHFLVIDSACSATQIATGQQSLPGAIGVNAEGYSAKSIFELAKEKGLSTGLVTDTRVTHATPASFAAHQASRKKEHDIALQLLKSDTDVLLSAGINHFLSQKNLNEYTSLPIFYTPKRKDGRDLLKLAKEEDYELVFSKNDFSKIKSPKVLGLFTAHEMPDGIWYTSNKQNPQRIIPTLKEMSEFALNKLSQNEEGFVLLVEAGQIDWAGHRNDAGLLLHQMLEANETLNFLVDWVQKRKDTSIVVTADHETGGFNLTYNKLKKIKLPEVKGPHYKGKYKTKTNYLEHSVLDKLYEQKLSIADMISIFENHPGEVTDADKLKMILSQNSSWNITDEDVQKILKSGEWANKKPYSFLAPAHYYNPLYLKIGAITKVFGPQTGVSFSTSGHTASPIPVFALSPDKSHEQFKAWQHHTDIGKKMQKLLQLIK